MIDEEYRQRVHDAYDEVRPRYVRIDIGFAIAGAILIAIGIKNTLFSVGVVGGLMLGAFLVNLWFKSRQKAHTDKVLDAAGGQNLEQTESAVRAARMVQRRGLEDSTGFDFEDSNYP